jgi:hypothetical protein
MLSPFLVERTAHLVCAICLPSLLFALFRRLESLRSRVDFVIFLAIHLLKDAQCHKVGADYCLVMDPV